MESKNKLNDLTNAELLEINGGGFFEDFGKWCKEKWCSIKDYKFEYQGETWNERNNKF